MSQVFEPDDVYGLEAQEAFDEEECAEVERVDGPLTDDQKAIMLISSASEQCEAVIQYLHKCEFESKLEIYRQMVQVDQTSFLWKCAIMWSIREETPYGAGKKPLTEAARELGMSYRTAQRKAQIWDKFYQNPESTSLSLPKRHYIFETLKNSETWYRLALMTEEPETTLIEADKKFEEASTTGGSYTPKNMKEDFGLLDQKDVEDAQQEATAATTEGECGCGKLHPVHETVVEWETNLDGVQKTPLLTFIREYFHEGKYGEGVRIKHLFTSCGTEIPL